MTAVLRNGGNRKSRWTADNVVRLVCIRLKREEFGEMDPKFGMHLLDLVMVQAFAVICPW